jgi:hypothetical protein
MYKKLSGMTGTADTEAYEFQSIYGLEVVVIPTNRPMVRQDTPDLVFLNRAGKYNAVVNWTSRSATRGPARAGRHHVDRNLRAAVRAVAGSRHRARSAQRQAARTRSAPSSPTPAPRCGDHRHQHGRSRYRHRARRFTGSRAHRAGRRSEPSSARMRADGSSATTRSRPPAACTSSAPNATNRAASTTSCVVVPAARAIRVRRASTCRSKTT